MSYINGLGFVSNLGSYYEGLNMQNNIFLNTLPLYFVCKYDNKFENFNNINDMNNYSLKYNIKTNIISKIKNNHYIWLDNKWNDLGKVNKLINIKIYNVESINEKQLKLRLFMFFYLNDLKSNIYNIIKLFNKENNYILNSKELNIYYGLNNDYYFNEIFFNILKINLKRGLTQLLNNICNMYNIPIINFNNFTEKVCIYINKILDNVLFNFLRIINDYNNIDISQLFNYISSCFSSYKEILKKEYNENIIESIINPENDLTLIDKPLINRFKLNNNLKSDFLEILQVINDIIYRTDNEESDNMNYYNELKNIIKYFKQSNNRLFSSNDNFMQLLEILCNGIGGIINSAMTLALISSGQNESKSQVYFNFLFSEKFVNI